MKVKAILYVSQATKEGKYPVKIRITRTENKKTVVKFISVGVNIDRLQWNKKDSMVKAHPNATEINSKIIGMVHNLMKNYDTDGSINLGDKSDFYWWFDKRLNYSKAKHGTYNYNKLVSIKAKLQEYAPTLKITQLTYEFVKNYELYLLNKGNIHNTVQDNLMRIKIIVNEIIKAGVLPYHKNPFLHIPISMKKTNRKRLPFEDIVKLKDLNVPDTSPSVQLAIDLYWFSFNNGGIRFGDLCRLKWDNIDDGRLRFIMHKTERERNVKLLPDSLKVLERYIRSEKAIKSNPNIFPIGVNWALNGSKDELTKEDKSINSRNTFYNGKLRLACKWAGIEQITFHTSRHSLADLAVRKKKSMRSLQEIFGHGKLATTEKYLQSFYREDSDSELASILTGN